MGVLGGSWQHEGFTKMKWMIKTENIWNKVKIYQQKLEVSSFFKVVTLSSVPSLFLLLFSKKRVKERSFLVMWLLMGCFEDENM